MPLSNSTSTTALAAAAVATSFALGCLTARSLLRRRGADREEEPPADADPAAACTPSQIGCLIRSRRSVFPKDYSGERVPREVVEAMLEAANWAPTHGKTEPWRFVVFDGADAIAALYAAFLRHARCTMSGEDLEKYEKKQARKAKDRANVSHLIAIVMRRRTKAPQKEMPEWEEVAACACAVQNMYLTATAHGVGGYWSSAGVKESAAVGGSAEVRSMLGLGGGEADGDGSEGDADDRCLGLFFLGQSEKIAGYRAKRGPIDEKVRWL